MKRKTPIRRTSSLTRKTPLGRGKPLKRGKGLRKARPSVRRAQIVQKEAIRKRAWDEDRGYAQCEFLISWAQLTVRCGNIGTDAAHIIPRRECGKARDLADVVILACRSHHQEYDACQGRTITLRVPKELLSRAKLAIKNAGMKAPMKKSVQDTLK